jgi:hypothetical protein
MNGTDVNRITHFSVNLKGLVKVSMNILGGTTAHWNHRISQRLPMFEIHESYVQSCMLHKRAII